MRFLFNPYLISHYLNYIAAPQFGAFAEFGFAIAENN